MLIIVLVFFALSLMTFCRDVESVTVVKHKRFGSFQEAFLADLEAFSELRHFAVYSLHRKKAETKSRLVPILQVRLLVLQRTT
jgi:hypothetical protein